MSFPNQDPGQPPKPTGGIRTMAVAAVALLLVVLWVSRPYLQPPEVIDPPKVNDQPNQAAKSATPPVAQRQSTGLPQPIDPPQPSQQPQVEAPAPSDTRPAPPVQRSNRAANRRNDNRSRRQPDAPASAAQATTISDVVIRDQSGQVVFKGDMDLQPTLERIAQGRELRFSHDGTTFGNRERRLPAHASAYYKEYVVPTPGLSGPGPQRLIVGRNGEVYYTGDHYRTFKKIAVDPGERQ